jgi:hypothetical protein
MATQAQESVDLRNKISEHEPSSTAVEDPVDASARKIVEAAPPLTGEQRVRLRALLGPLRSPTDREL